MRMMKANLCLIWLLAASLPARAIQVGGSTNTSDPGTPVWNYVGSIGGASGVFIGNYDGYGWVLTAGHVGAGSFTLGSTTFSTTGTSFTNFVYNSTTADLTLFQISGTPSLSNLSFLRPAAGNTVEMVGFGGGKSWGDNTIHEYANYTLDGYPYGGPGIVTLASGFSGNGAQGVGGDSGGGMFYEGVAGWSLVGILSATGDLGSGLGNGTIAVDLGPYLSQISANIHSVAIPEPSSFAVMCGLGALIWSTVIRRRRTTRD